MPIDLTSTQPNVTVRQAETFCHVVRCGSFVQAAREWGMKNHVALIRRVERMAEAVGQGKLVTATPRGEVTLTLVGQRVLPLAHRLVETASEIKSASRVIRFSSYPSIAGLVARRCTSLLVESEVPLEMVRIREASRDDGGSELVDSVERGELDLVIAPRNIGGVHLKEDKLYEWKLRVAFPDGDPNAAKNTVHPRDLAGYRVVAAPRGHRSRYLLAEAFADDGVPLEMAFELGSQELMRDIARNSKDCAAVLPDDAFGEINETIGPVLKTKTGPVGGAYSIYKLGELEMDDQRTPDHVRRAIGHATAEIVKNLST